MHPPRGKASQLPAIFATVLSPNKFPPFSRGMRQQTAANRAWSKRGAAGGCGVPGCRSHNSTTHYYPPTPTLIIRHQEMTSSPVFASLAFVASCARRKAAAPTTIAVVATRRTAATAADITIINSNSNTNVNLRSFRKVINSRISARRFQPNTPIPNAVWKDILSMTLVRVRPVVCACLS
jgi:hypothetical protein